MLAHTTNDMTCALAIKLEPGTSVVPNLKYEPTDESEESGQLKITNVFSISADNVIQPPKDTNSLSRSPNKLANKESATEICNDIPPEDTTSCNRYGFRKRSVRTYEENLDQPNSSSPVPIRKQKLKTTKKQLKPIITQDVLTCDICSTVFFSVESLEEHVIEMHVVDKEFKCTECTESFISQDGLDSHRTEHEKEEEVQGGHKCPVCSRTVSCIQHLNRHMLTHNAVKPFKCKLCPNSYSQENYLQAHEMNQHGKEKKFKCSKCPKSFARNYTLQDHLRTHSNAKSIVCENCRATFKTKQSLRNHRVYCKGTSSQNNLPIHDVTQKNLGKVKSKRRIAVENKRKKRTYEYKQHKCSVCDKVCMSLGNLRIHMVIHSDERKFKCNLCSVTYKRKPELNMHLKLKHSKGL